MPMPSLGFLKKKRTRDGNSDPSSSNPTSPVTSKPFDTSSQPRTLSGLGQAGAAAPSQSGQSQSDSNPAAPIAQQQQQQAPQQQPIQGQEQQQQPPPPQQQQQTDGQMNPQFVQGTAYAAAPGVQDPQNLPTISNLMNPQSDGSANHYSTSPYPAVMSNSNPHTASASPGTDPELLKQQQQQAHPVPAMQPQHQQHLQADTHMQQQHHMQQQQMAQARVTKGKYSLGDFEILRTLGTGSFGRVHLVQSRHNQRFYAIKVLKKAQVVKMKQVEHTNDERRMLSDVKHPFLVTLWGTFQDWKNLYMVMDFVEGGELFSLLRKSGVSIIR